MKEKKREGREERRGEEKKREERRGTQIGKEKIKNCSSLQMIVHILKNFNNSTKNTPRINN